MPFIENAGQWREEALYGAALRRGAFFVTEDGAMVYLIERHSEDGASRAVAIEERVLTTSGLSVSGAGRMAGKARYFCGSHSRRRAAQAFMYERLEFGEVYESVGLDLHARGSNVEKEFTVDPGGNPADIRLKVTGAAGLGVAPDGRLLVATPQGELSFSRPVAYQDIGGTRQFVDVAYAVDGTEYGFELGAFSPGHALVIDPLLEGTYFGGSEGDGLLEIPMVMHTGGHIYVADRTKSWDLPTTPAGYDTSFSAAKSDIFISKFDGDLNTLVASTFLGGTGFEGGWPGANLVLGEDGSVWVAAMTRAGDFPATPGAYDTTYNGSGDFFIAHLTSDLEHLLAATYLGGSNVEERPHLAVGDDGYVYLLGNTRSVDYPAVYGCIDTTYGGGNSDVVVTRLDTALSDVHASTYLGGGGFDAPEDILLDAEGYPYITGWTMSAVWPTTPGAFRETYMGRSYDAFITRLNPDLTQVSASTFLGGSRWDFVFDMVMEGDSVIYVTGHTASDDDFPLTPGAYDSTYGGAGIEGSDDDCFVSKLTADLAGLLASTYLGGTVWENGYGLALDGEGHIYVAGTTCSDDFPTEPGAYDRSYGGSANPSAGDVFVTRLDTSLSALTASTYIGGSGVDQLGSIIWGEDGLYVSMGTNTEGLETSAGAYDHTFNGGESMSSGRNWGGDVYVVKLDPLLCDETGSAPRREDPVAGAVLSARPNPFSENTAMSFSLPEPSPVRLIIHDVSGGVVRVLLRRDMGAGRHSVVWDGRDASGDDVAPGIYFSVLERGGDVTSIKVVSVR